MLACVVIDRRHHRQARTSHPSAPRPFGPFLNIPYNLVSAFCHIFFLFNFLRTLLYSRKTQPFCFQSLPHSFAKTPGVGVGGYQRSTISEKTEVGYRSI